MKYLTERVVGCLWDLFENRNFNDCICECTLKIDFLYEDASVIQIDDKVHHLLNAIDALFHVCCFQFEEIDWSFLHPKDYYSFSLFCVWCIPPAFHCSWTNLSMKTSENRFRIQFLLFSRISFFIITFKELQLNNSYIFSCRLIESI